MNTEHLTQDEIDYHRKVIAQVQAALSIRDSWVAHLSQKYKLAQGDAVQEDGAVVRAKPLPPEEGTLSAVG